jgi:uncharacterized OB-fold protein
MSLADRPAPGGGELTPLAPVPDEDGEPFWAAARAGELRMQACASCDRLRFPPRPMCPWCGSVASTWRLMSGRGTIWSYAVPHPPLLPAYAAVAPYNVIVVALDEDPTLRLAGNLVTREDGPINEIDPATITIGAPVRVVFPTLAQAAGSSMVLPRWILT